MKNILLSVVVISTLLAAGIGGTFAHFSDTEEAFDNYLQTDEMDLKVSTVTKVAGQWVSGGEYDQPNIPALVTKDDYMEPCLDYSFHFDLHNVSEAITGYAYMHLKNPRCEDIPTKYGDPKPEPEIVAEQGGMVGQVEVPGIGDIPCFLSRHIEVVSIEVQDMAGNTIATVDLTPYDTDPANNVVKMNELICHNIPLCEIPACNSVVVLIDFHLQDIDEDDLIAEGLLTGPTPPAPGDGGWFDGTDPDMQKKCWDHWPSNALQKDKILFDILFSLSQIPF
jgi:predicted ribosomally synthesized peptide with SipW-like signal peptide